MTTQSYSTEHPPHPLPAVWASRRLLHQLMVRNLKVKYQRSSLGFLWTLFNPLLMIGVLVLVFSKVIRIEISHYWAFLISGYFMWNFLAQMLTTGTYILAEHGQLARAVYFPVEVPLLAATAARLVEFIAEMTLALLLLVVFHHGYVPTSFALLPLLLVIQILMTLGLTMPLAIVSVFYHDVEHALPAVVTLLFYLCPVFYDLSLVPAAWQPIYLLNPLASLLTLYHTVLYEGQMPPRALVLTASVMSLLMVTIGYAVFNRYKTDCTEII